MASSSGPTAGPTLSYRGLSEPGRRAFRLAGLLRGRDFAEWSLAALLDVPEPVAERLLAELADAGLVVATGTRYRMPALPALLAAELVESDDRAGTRDAVRRLGTAWLARIAEVARRLCGPPLLPPARRETLPVVDDPVLAAGPMEWFATERPGLQPVVELLCEWRLGTAECWLIVHCAHEVFESSGAAAEWERACRTGLAAAQEAGDRIGVGYMMYGLAAALSQDRPEEAIAQSRRASGLLFAAGDRWGAALASGSMADLAAVVGAPDWPAAVARAVGGLYRVGEDGWAAFLESLPATYTPGVDAVHRHERCLRVLLAEGAHRRVAIVRRQLARSYEQAGRPADAEAALAAVMAWCVGIGDQRGIARVHVDLSRLRSKAGDLAAAERHLTDAIEVSRRVRDDLARHVALTQLARLRIQQRRLAEAVRNLDEACTGLRALHATRYLEQAERLRSTVPA